MTRFIFLLITLLYSSVNAAQAAPETSSLVFVILCHVRNSEDEAVWKRCHQSVRQFYPSDLIVVIDDNSPLPVRDRTLTHTKFIRSEFPGAGELLPYHYFLKYCWKKKMVFLHDSMYLHRAFTPQELSSSIKFHWHISTHAFDNEERINHFLSFLPRGEELMDYVSSEKESWWGCFGVASIIDLKFLQRMERKYAFVKNLIRNVHNREDRMALERVFGLLCFHGNYVTKENCSNFGYGEGYPAFSEDYLNECKKNPEKHPNAIIKTFRGR